MLDDKPGTERCPRCAHIECRCGWSSEDLRCIDCDTLLGPFDDVERCDWCNRATDDRLEAEAERRHEARNRANPDDRPEPESEAEVLMRRGGMTPATPALIIGASMAALTFAGLLQTSTTLYGCAVSGVGVGVLSGALVWAVGRVDE